MADYTIGKLVWKIEGDTSGVDQSLKKTESGLGRLTGVVKGFLGIGLVAGFIGIAKSALSASAAMESNKVAFSTMLGSAEKANALLKDMTKFAASTPFQLPEIVAAGKSLLAFGFTAEEVIPTMRKLGDVASALNIPIGELSDLYGKMKTQNVIQAEELNQLAGRGLPIFKELAIVMGKEASEVKKLGSEGKITFKELETAITNMTKEGSQFGGLMQAQSQTLSGQWSNFGDNLGRIATIIGDKLAPAAKGLIGAFNWMLESGDAEFSREMEKIVGLQEQIIKKYGEQSTEADQYEGLLETAVKEIEAEYGMHIKIGATAKERLEIYKQLIGKSKEEAQIMGLVAGTEEIRSNLVASDLDLYKKKGVLTKEEIKAQRELNKESAKGGKKAGSGESEATKLRRETFEKNIAYEQLESEKISQELENRQALYKKLNLNKQSDIDAMAEYEKNAQKEITKAEQKELAERIGLYNNYAQQIGGSITGLLSAFENLFAARAQADIDSLDAQLEAELEAAGVSEETTAEQAQREYDAAVATGDALAIEEKRRALVKAQIEEKYAKKKAQAEYEAALIGWEFQLASATIAAPLAVMNALTSGWAAAALNPALAVWYPALLAGVAGLSAGVQIAAVTAAKPQAPKYASGGIIPGSAQGTQIIAGDGGTELVSNADQMANILQAIGNGAGAGGGVRQLPPISKEDLFNMIFNASQNGDLFIAERSLVKR